MCGICGKMLFRDERIEEGFIRQMCRFFTYRGPDDEGVLVSPPVGLGHQRLSIIELSSSGHQPMSNEDETR